MSDIYKINVSMLKSYEKDFNAELNNFNNKAYNTFSSSYLKNCSDAYVRRMSSELQALYEKVKKGYQNIDKWWTEYNENIEGLENYLSDNGNIGAMSESSIRNSANQLPHLKEYNIKFSGIVPTAVVGASYNAAFANNTVVSSIDPFSSLFSEYRVSEASADEVVNNNNIVNQIGEAISTAHENVTNWAKNVGNDIKNFFESPGATISAFGENIISKASETIDDVDNFFDETKAYITNKAESLWTQSLEWLDGATQKASDWFTQVGTDISEGAKSLWADIKDWWVDVEDWWTEDALPVITSATSIIFNIITSVRATVAVFATSLVEGLLQFAEAIVDFAALVGTGVASIITGLIDGGQAIYGAITGNEWSSLTKQMWNNTQGFVSKKFVSGWFDLFYQKTTLGNYLATKALFFDAARSVGTGIGYTAGVIVLTIATFGAGSVVAAGGTVSVTSAVAATTTTQMAITATAAGIGKGTQNAWLDGADLTEGLVAGTLTGVWEGIQFWVGGKISKLNLVGSKGIIKALGADGIKTKLFNSLMRVVLDGADGGIEGIVTPLITATYKDGYFDDKGNYVEFLDDTTLIERFNEIFDDSGGMSAVWTQAVIGAGASLVGELFDLRKYFKEEKAKVADTPNKSGDVSKVTDNIETEKVFDYDNNQTTVDLFGNTDTLKQKQLKELEDIKLELQKEVDSLDVTDIDYYKKRDAFVRKAQLQEELVKFAHSKGMTFEEYVKNCGKISQLDEATQKIVNQKAKSVFNTAKKAEPKISKMMKSLEVNGAQLEGFNHRFKSEDSIARKISTNLYGSVSVDAIDNAASSINDSLRYTLLLDEDKYMTQMYESLYKLTNEGYQVYSMNNSWGNPIYQGLNTTLFSPDGIVFELQFHTAASFKTKEFLNHQFYEIFRSPLAGLSEYNAAKEIMQINQQMYVKTIDGMVDLTKLNILDNASYRNYSSYDDFVAHYSKKISSWKSTISNKQKMLFNNYIGEGVDNPGNYAAVNGLARNTLMDYTNRTVLIQDTSTYTRPDPISFEEFENIFLPIDFQGRKITTVEEFINMQRECFLELDSAVSKMSLDEPTIMYRGINLNALENLADDNGVNVGIKIGDSLETIFNKIKAAGGVYSDKGFMSASPVPVGVTTRKDVILKIKCKTGLQGVDLKSVGGFENEFLIAANQLFDVVGFGRENVSGIMKNVLYLVSK